MVFLWFNEWIVFDRDGARQGEVFRAAICSQPQGARQVKCCVARGEPWSAMLKSWVILTLQ